MPALTQRVRSRLRHLLPWRTETAYFYNLRVGRDPRQVTRELVAFAKERPLYVGLCETTGYDLPDLPGYTRIRDTSTPARANVAAYCRDDFPPGNIVWEDLERDWRRTEHPGRHEPRSLVTFGQGLRVTVGHAPPLTRYGDTRPAQQEMVDALTPILDPRQREGWRRRAKRSRAVATFRPRHLVWDANRRPGETGPGPTMLASRVGGLTVGHRIDCAVVTNTQPVEVDYPTSVGGVKLRSDHGCAFRMRFRVWGSWLR